MFYIPKAFTPNRDQINDVFMPHVSGVKEYNFYVYSRHGQEIFYTNKLDNDLAIFEKKYRRTAMKELNKLQGILNQLD